MADEGNQTTQGSPFEKAERWMNMKLLQKKPPSWTILFAVFLLTLFVSSCASQPDATEATTNTPVTVTAAATTESDVQTEVVPDAGAAASGGIGSVDVLEAATAVAARTPVPTRTPRPVESEIAEISSELGLSDTSFLGISVEVWIEVLISVLIIVIGYFLSAYLLPIISRWLARHISNRLDSQLIEQTIPDLKWLVFLFFVSFAVLRLEFLSDTTRKLLEDLFFVIGLVLVTVLGIRLIKYGIDWYNEKLESDTDRVRLAPITSAVQRALTVVLLIVILTIGLSYFGINVGLLVISLLVLAVVVSLGLRDTIADAIGGFVILLDQPFRVHDGIYIGELDTWGDVTEIGTRATRILTRDYREVIIPNSKILNSKVVNYTYPDPAFRMEVDLRIAYDSDLEKARQVVVETLRNTDRVLAEKKIEFLYIGFKDTARHIRVRWWLADYHLQWPMLDVVCTAIDLALNQAGIEIPIATYDLNVNMEDGRR
jgi:small-conductance mechanosensitive channel